jgi:hypothetical protein
VSTTDIEVFPMKLPWDIQANLDAEARFASVLELDGEYTIEFLLLGILAEDNCSEGETAIEAVNVTGSVELRGTFRTICDMRYRWISLGRYNHWEKSLDFKRR